MTAPRTRVLFLVESLAGGGAEKVLSVLAEHLDKSRFEVTVLAVVNTGAFRDSVRRHARYAYFLDDPTGKVPYWNRLAYRLRYNLIRRLPARYAYRWLIREAFDVEVAFLEGFATKVISASDNPRSRKLAWVHIDLQNQHWTTAVFPGPGLEARAYARFDRIICVSRQVKEGVDRLFGMQEKTLVLHNPIDRQEILEKALEATPSSAPRGRIRLVSVGRLAEQKGFDRLLNIHRTLVAEGLDHELWILGEGPQRPVLEAFIRLHRLEGSARLLGFQANPFALISQCDLFVCSSRAEGFSTVVTEALILGVPVVSTDCSGARELLGNGDEFGIVTANTEDALCAGLRALLRDPARLAHYRREAERRGVDFGLEKTLPAVEALLEAET